MRDHDELPYVVIERHSASLASFLWGVFIGAGAALLLAPRSGAETQDGIRQGVRRVRSAAEDRVEAARSTVTRARSRIEDQIGSVREQIDSVRDRMESRAESGRDRMDSDSANTGEAHDRRVFVAGSSMKADRPGGADRPVDIILTDAVEEPVDGRIELG